jgi:hypothetical protein
MIRRLHQRALLQWLRRVAAPVARQRLLRRMTQRRLPRIAVVKQDCNEDLYCCAPEAGIREMLASTLLRSGPVSLFTKFDARFFIVRTEPDPECNLWREKSDPLGWAPLSWFEAFRDHIPGRDHGQSRHARSVDDVPWGDFDLVISVDVSIPERVTRQFPEVVWAYYIRELKAPSWKTSFERPVAGQDLYLSHLFAPARSRAADHVVDFPYHFQHCGTYESVFGAEADPNRSRQGVFVEYHTALAATDDEIRQLGEFGPVFARRPAEACFDASSGESIPFRSMSGVDRAALFSSKYHVKWGGRRVFGTSKVEAIAAGCLSLTTSGQDGSPFLHSVTTSVRDFPSLIAALRRLESSEYLYRRERERQQQLVDYLCFLRPANDLFDACDRVRRRRNHR